MLAAVLAAYWWALQTGREEGAVRAIAFAAIVLGNLALLFAMRSRERTILATVRQPNPALWWISAGALAALAAAIYVPAAASLFRFSPLGVAELAAAAAAGISGVAWIELAKLVRRRNTAGISP
jgi:Ca2+-transporting ATPase